MFKKLLIIRKFKKPLKLTIKHDLWKNYTKVIFWPIYRKILNPQLVSVFWGMLKGCVGEGAQNKKSIHMSHSGNWFSEVPVICTSSIENYASHSDICRNEGFPRVIILMGVSWDPWKMSDSPKRNLNFVFFEPP